MEELKGYYPEDDKYFSFFDIDGSSSLSHLSQTLKTSSLLKVRST
jgi:hypothetical protein